MLLPKTYQAKIVKNLILTPRVHQIVLELVEPKTIEFTAGQFLMYQITDNSKQTTENRQQTTNTVKRAYSIASLPSEALAKERTPGKVELFIDIAPGGPASQYFATVTEGTNCTFTAPYGQFVLRDTPNDKIFIAGSTGVAPVRSMILEYLNKKLTANEREPAAIFSGVKSQTDIGSDSSKIGQVSHSTAINLSLYFGVNKTEEMFLLEEFSSLEFENSNFHYIPVVRTSEHGNWAGEKGLVTDALFCNVTDLKSKDFYLCGSPGMVAAVKQQLLEKGVDLKNIFNEGF